MEVLENCNQLLVDLLRHHDVACTHEGDIIAIASGRFAHTNVFLHSEADDSCSVQLDVAFLASPGKLIVESFAGVGANREEAIQSAQHSFMQASLHVIMQALFAINDPDQVLTEHWHTDGIDREAMIGPLCTRGQYPDEMRDCFPQIEPYLRALSLPAGLHWIRLFYAQLPDGNVVEALVDNEPNEQLAKNWGGLRWPSTESYYSARIFLIFRGGIDLCAEAVSVLCENPEADETQLIAQLQQKGLSATDSERLIMLAPLAFARALLDHLPVKFTENAIIVPNDGRNEMPLSFKLKDDPHFAALSVMATSALNYGSLTREQFDSLSFRSAEFNGINNSLNNLKEGQDANEALKKTRMFPPIFFYDEDAFDTVASFPSAEPVNNEEAELVTAVLTGDYSKLSKPAEPPPAAEKKPWWKIW